MKEYYEKQMRKNFENWQATGATEKERVKEHPYLDYRNLLAAAIRLRG